MEWARIECESRIDRVAVHARGALVSRSISLTAKLPAEAVELSIPGVTAAADPGSLRAETDGTRAVLSVRARLIVPAAPAAPGAIVDRLRQVQWDRHALTQRRGAITERRSALMALKLEPGFTRRSRVVDPASRTRDALAAEGLLAERIAALDAALRELAAEVDRLAHEIERMEIEAGQARSAETAGEGHPSYEVSVMLAPGSGTPALVEITYAVAAARWWPTYTARFGPRATRVDFALDAFVAQCTGEDWNDVELALTTADLIHDARLPELPSLRLGRAQGPPHRGYRPPPSDTEALFAGFRRVAETYAASRRVASDSFGASFQSAATGAPPPAHAPEYAAPQGGRPEPPRGGATPASFAAPAPALPGLGGTATVSPVVRAKSVGMLGAVGDLLEGGGGEAPKSFESQESSTIEPEEGWLDFDAVSIGGVGEVTRAGRLVRADRQTELHAVRSGRARVELLVAPSGAPDPREARGQFDHRYTSEGRREIPSDAIHHRVTVAVADAQVTTRFRAVPRITLDVFREAEIRNPFGVPLLAGPVDVFIDGALAARSAMAPVDRGGVISIGIGVEDRIRVARNARIEEASAGLLGGTTAIDHTVTVDVVSSLARPVVVDVVERIPVTDDRDIDVSVTSSVPRYEKYEQIERGAPLRRGVRWNLEVPSAGSARIEFGYRISLPAKSEIVGGNRRE